MEQTSNPIRALTQDHEEVQKKLPLLRAGARGLREGGTPEALTAVSQVIQFLDTELRVHMRLEEEALFPVLERHIGREGGPIGVMLAEHQELWDQVAQLQQAVAELKQGGGASASEKASRLASSIAGLLDAHIPKENMILFPLAERVLTPAEMAEVARRGEAVVSPRD